jgi:hypothetical protein
MWSFPIGIGGRVFLANLVVIAVQWFDVVLRMDWLVKHYARIDCVRKEVTFRPLEGEAITFVGSRV